MEENQNKNYVIEVKNLSKEFKVKLKEKGLKRYSSSNLMVARI